MHLVSGRIQYLVKIISSDTRCNTNTGVTKVTIIQLKRAEASGLEVLDAVIHMDESTPHVHIRFIGVAQDSRGFDKPDMTNCLKANGYSQTTADGDKKKANQIQGSQK